VAHQARRTDERALADLHAGGDRARAPTTANRRIVGPGALVRRWVGVVEEDDGRGNQTSSSITLARATKTLLWSRAEAPILTSGWRSQSVPARTPVPIAVPSRIVTRWPDSKSSPIVTPS
jgi:hypothetical protein